ncbi:MAG TPA: hypothetical protein VNT79_00830 [Phycisphaerae bacterium]|nr:hypothetical protein [Phycisphaerae bacterium]
MAIVEPTDANTSAVSWAAIVAGGLSALAMTVVFIALGSAVGLASISPWTNSGASATTIKWTAGAFLVLTALISSALGGYIAGRLRTKWTGVQSDEVTFRDTAHGFLAWAFGTVFGVLVIGTATTSLLGSATTGAATGAATGSAQAAAQGSPSDYFVDSLLRREGAAPAAPAADAGDTRREVGLIMTRSLSRPEGISAADRTYLAQVVAARTGRSPTEAEARVTEVVNAAKTALDETRKFSAVMAGWLTLAMFVGAFAAAAAAIEGGQLRDGRWRGVIFAKNYRSNPVN